MELQPKDKTINFPNLGSLNKKRLSCLVDFGSLDKGVGAWVNLLKKWKFVVNFFFIIILSFFLGSERL